MSIMFPSFISHYFNLINTPQLQNRGAQKTSQEKWYWLMITKQVYILLEPSDSCRLPLRVRKSFSQFRRWIVALMGLKWAFRIVWTGVPYLLSSLFCPIYNHNSLQHLYGNWEAIISKLRPKWCLNKKIVMKVKAGKTLLTLAGDGRMKGGKMQEMILYCS